MEYICFASENTQTLLYGCESNNESLPRYICSGPDLEDTPGHETYHCWSDPTRAFSLRDALWMEEVAPGFEELLRLEKGSMKTHPYYDDGSFDLKYKIPSETNTDNKPPSEFSFDPNGSLGLLDHFFDWGNEKETLFTGNNFTYFSGESTADIPNINFTSLPFSTSTDEANNPNYLTSSFSFLDDFYTNIFENLEISS